MRNLPPVLVYLIVVLLILNFVCWTLGLLFDKVLKRIPDGSENSDRSARARPMLCVPLARISEYVERGRMFIVLILNLAHIPTFVYVLWGVPYFGFLSVLQLLWRGVKLYWLWVKHVTVIAVTLEFVCCSLAFLLNKVLRWILNRSEYSDRLARAEVILCMLIARTVESTTDALV